MLDELLPREQEVLRRRFGFMSDEQQTLEALKVARELRPDVPIIARCTFSSAGLQAAKLGAAAVVVAEQVVAREFAQLLQKSIRL